MQTRSWGIGGLALAVLGASSSAQAPSLEAVLSRTATYVSGFIPQYANLVAEEAYEQHTFTNTATANGLTRERVVRRLRSDLLLVRYPNGELDWMLFRDVAEVDATPVSHPEGRLIRLFTEGVLDAEQKAARIASESNKFHIPGGSFAVTNPLLVVALAQRHYQPRLRFTLGGEERSLGAGVRVLRFEEHVRVPALLGNEWVRGNIWLEVATGRIVKTEARIGTGTNASTTITTFVPDERLGIMVPREMRTTWFHPQPPPRASRTVVNGVATYGEFRRFDVRTDASVARPSQP